MDSLGSLYSMLTNKLQLVHNSEVDVSRNVLSFVADMQSLCAGLFPMNTSNHSSVLSQLSIVKLFLELMLSAPKCALTVKAFNKVFTQNFLEALIAQDRFCNRLTLAYLISELTALFLFVSHKLGINDHLYHRSAAVYLESKCMSTRMKLHVVNSLCCLQKKYKNDSFATKFSDIFCTVIWNHDIIRALKADRMFFVKLCLDALSTSAVDQIRAIIFQDFGFFIDVFSVVDDTDLKSCVCMFLNELFLHQSEETDMIVNTAVYILLALKKSDYALLRGADIPTSIIAVLRITSWILDERYPSSYGKEYLAGVFAAFECFDMTTEKLIHVCSEEDKELIDFLMLHLDLSWIIRKKGLSDVNLPLLTIEPWHLFLELMLKLSFDELVLNDWLISNETHFLRYFVKLCKMLRLFWTEFNETCWEISENQRVQEILSTLGASRLLDACMSAFIRLKFKIVRLNKASLYPYSPEPLIKLLTSLEDMYECEEEEDHT